MSPRSWIFALVTAIYSEFSTAQPLIFAANDWCPFICDTESEQPGILVEIVRTVYQGEREVLFRRLPLARGIIETRANRTQGILGVMPEAAPDLVFPPLPAVTTRLCFFTLTSSNWSYDGNDHHYPDTLVGIVQSKYVDDRFIQGFPNRVTIHGERDTAIRLIQLLERGRIDTLIEEKTSINYTLSRNSKLPNLRQAGCSEEKPEYIAFSPATQAPQTLATEFAEKLEKLKRSGRIDAIFKRYGTSSETIDDIR